MRLYPTRPAFHVALAGAALVATGVGARMPLVVSFGAVVLLTVALGRGLAFAHVAGLRAAGFEMVWNTAKRTVALARDGSVDVEVELRNRSNTTVRAVGLRAVSSSPVDVTLAPSEVLLPARSAVTVRATVCGRRVGRHAVHALALEVRTTTAGGDGLYEVPLMFASPLGVHVLPRALVSLASSARGGRTRATNTTGASRRVKGDGDELRELRELQPGDPFKRIAWKASARRGRLLVREFEREQPSCVWLVVDASVERWAGPVGLAPMDSVVDEVASTAARLLARGEPVGLAVVAGRLRSWIRPDTGPSQIDAIARALASCASFADADRSELDETEVAARVVEHLRPLDPKGLAGVGVSDLDALAERAEQQRARAPFSPRVPYATTPRERVLRHYLQSFGVDTPPRSEGEGPAAARTLAEALRRIAAERARPTSVLVWAPATRAEGEVVDAVVALRRARVTLRWSLDTPTEALREASPDTVELVVGDAVRARSEVAHARAARALRRAGVLDVVRSRPTGSGERAA